MKRVGLKGVFVFILLSLLTNCSAPPSAPSSKARIFPVKVGLVEQRDIPMYIETIGHVSSASIVEIHPQVSGTIIDIRIKEASYVKAGDILFRLDPVPYQLALEKAWANYFKDQAALEYAHKKVERYSALVKGDFVSKLSIEEYKRDVKALEAQLLIDKSEIGIAKTNLDYSTIVSPLDGRVSIGHADVGNVVSPNTTEPLVTIYQIKPINVVFSLAQSEFERLQKVLAEGKRTFTVILPTTRQEFEGQISVINNQVDPKTGTIQIKGIVPNQDEILWPGEFVNVRISLGMKAQVAVIPFTGLQVGPQGNYVYLLNSDQTVEQVSVKTGENLGDYIVIDEGLKVGLPIITDGQINLKSGAKVMVIEENGKPLEAQP